MGGRLQWLATQGMDDLEQTKPLPMALRVRIFRELHGHSLDHFSFFDGMLDNQRMWGMLIDSMEFVSFASGDFIVREGDVADGMYIVRYGECEMITEFNDWGGAVKLEAEEGGPEIIQQREEDDWSDVESNEGDDEAKAKEEALV